MEKWVWQSSPNANEASRALSGKVEELRRLLRSRNPAQLAERTGCQYEEGGFHIKLFKQLLLLSFPDLVAMDSISQKVMPVSLQALLLYYFSTADGTPLSGRWISFAELPDGRIYNQAFQGYTGDLLARRFGAAPEELERASSLQEACIVSYGDKGFSFLALPRVSLLTVLWLGDEDFPASAKVLFDSSVIHYLPTDVCAILGSMLTRKLLVG